MSFEHYELIEYQDHADQEVLRVFRNGASIFDCIRVYRNLTGISLEMSRNAVIVALGVEGLIELDKHGIWRKVK